MSRVSCIVGAAGAVAAAMTPVVAQDVATGEVDRLVVTTTGRAEPLDTMPVAVSLIDSAQLRLADADHIQELVNRVPGVFVHRGSGQEHLTAIRSPVLTAGAGAGSFLFLEDGVPLRAAGFANINGLFESTSELASGVEVTRGPGSALYGSNAVHGIINVLTPTPAADEVRWELSTGSFHRNKAQATIARAGEHQGALLGLSILDENGWRQSAGVDQQKLLARWDADHGRWRTRASVAFVNLNQETAGFVETEDGALLEAYEDPAVFRTNPNPEAHRDVKSARAHVRAEVDVNDGLTLAVTPYARWTDMQFLQHFLPSQALEENGHWSVGALTTAYWDAPERFDLTAGLDLEFTRGFLSEVQELETIFSFTQGVHYDYEIDALVAAPYAQLDYDIAPRWRLQLGGRVELVEYDYVNNEPDTDPDDRFVRPDDRTDDFVAFTPKLALVRELPNDGVAYLRAARGARAPQTTDLYRLQFDQLPGEAEVERLNSVELGWRGLVGPARADLAVFAMEKENFYFRDSAGDNVTDGETRHIGVEGDVSWPIMDALELALAATYARHTYRFNNEASSITSGDDIDTAPRLLANARLAWTPVSSLVTELEWVFVDEYFMNEANTVAYPGHDVLNLRAEWSASEAISVFGAVRNLTDTRYAERADFAFGSRRYFPGEERAFTIGLRGAF